MDPFLGEIRMFTWAWAPQGWALCNGTALPIQQNAALNALLGQTFGGNGTTSFNLPDLRGRTPIGFGVGADGLNYNYGNSGGLESVTLTSATIPPHTHSITALGGTKGNTGGAGSSLPATVGLGTGGATVNIYSVNTAATLVQLTADSFSTTGSSGPHNNMQPFLVTNFCIATMGLFPPRQ